MIVGGGRRRRMTTRTMIMGEMARKAVTMIREQVCPSEYTNSHQKF